MSNNKPEKQEKESRAESPLERLKEISHRLSKAQRPDGSYDLDMFLHRIIGSEIPLFEIDPGKVLNLFLFNVLEYTGATAGGVYSVGLDATIQCLCDVGLENRITSRDFIEIHQIAREMIEQNVVARKNINGQEFAFCPLDTGIGGNRHFLVLGALRDDSTARTTHLKDSVQFEAACRTVRKHLFFSELLRDTKSELLRGNLFFRAASVEFDLARLEGRPLAMGAIAFQPGKTMNRDQDIHSGANLEGSIASVRGAFREGDLLSIHDPYLLVVLMPSVSKEEIERCYHKLKRAVASESSRPGVLFGVSYYDGAADSNFSEFLMTLSEALDACLDGKADLVIKHANVEAFSRFSLSDRAAELIYQSLDPDKLLTLYKINQVLGGVYRPERLLNNIMDLAIAAVGAERGLFCVEEEEGDLRVAVSRNTEDAKLAELNNISRSIIRETLKNRKPLFSQDVEKDEHLSGRESVISYGIRSVLCVPLFKDDTLYGAIYLDVRSGRKRFGLSDLIFLKAFSNQAMLAIENARTHEQNAREIVQLREEVAGGVEPIIGQSPAIRKILKKVEVIRGNDVTVLLEGESGTGKELIASAIHARSPRNGQSFLTVDCSAISDNIVESELFGHARGAYTDAVTDRTGIFEEADGGTVFLDEVDSLNKQLQGKLLRVLESGEVRRLGENRYRSVDVRIITTTKIDLRKAVDRGDFREDLYYRLNVFKIRIPPLRARRRDIPLLANFFLQKFCLIYGKKIRGLSEDAREYLSENPWRGNVRELRNAVERAVVSTTGEIIERKHLRGDEGSAKTDSAEKITLKEKLRLTQLQAINDALGQSCGNVTAAAEALGLTRRGLQKLIQKHEIDKEEFR